MAYTGWTKIHQHASHDTSEMREYFFVGLGGMEWDYERFTVITVQMVRDKRMK